MLYRQIKQGNGENVESPARGEGKPSDEFEGRSNWREGDNRVWTFLSKGKNTCKGPEAGMFLAGPRYINDCTAGGSRALRGCMDRDEIREELGAKSYRALVFELYSTITHENNIETSFFFCSSDSYKMNQKFSCRRQAVPYFPNFGYNLISHFFNTCIFSPHKKEWKLEMSNVVFFSKSHHCLNLLPAILPKKKKKIKKILYYVDEDFWPWSITRKKYSCRLVLLNCFWPAPFGILKVCGTIQLCLLLVLAMPAVCGSSQGQGWNHATAVTPAAALTMQDP